MAMMETIRSGAIAGALFAGLVVCTFGFPKGRTGETNGLYRARWPFVLSAGVLGAICAWLLPSPSPTRSLEIWRVSIAGCIVITAWRALGKPRRRFES